MLQVESNSRVFQEAFQRYMQKIPDNPQEASQEVFALWWRECSLNDLSERIAQCVFDVFEGFSTVSLNIESHNMDFIFLQFSRYVAQSQRIASLKENQEHFFACLEEKVKGLKQKVSRRDLAWGLFGLMRHLRVYGIDTYSPSFPLGVFTALGEEDLQTWLLSNINFGFLPIVLNQVLQWIDPNWVNWERFLHDTWIKLQPDWKSLVERVQTMQLDVNSLSEKLERGKVLLEEAKKKLEEVNRMEQSLDEESSSQEIASPQLSKRSNNFMQRVLRYEIRNHDQYIQETRNYRDEKSILLTETSLKLDQVQLALQIIEEKRKILTSTSREAATSGSE